MEQACFLLVTSGAGIAEWACVMMRGCSIAFSVLLVACSSSYGTEKTTSSDSNQTEGAPLPPRVPGAPPSAAPSSSSPHPGQSGGPQSGSHGGPTGDPDGGADGGSGNVCPADRPGPSPWKPPPSSTNVCTTSDVQYFVTQYNNSALTWADIQTAMKAKSQKCATCIFSSESDLNWRAIVLFTSPAGTGFFNWGSCAWKATGGNENCGRAYEHVDWCFNTVCGGCADQASYDTCSNNAYNDPNSCGADVAAGRTACGSSTYDNLVNVSCAYPEDVIRSLCGG
jgi:hypothetical protein